MARSKRATGIWMTISGMTGFAFFLVANFTNLFIHANFTAGCIQILINTFVFVAWLRGFRESTGFRKFVAFFGIIVPIIMASITIVRVLLPALLTSP